MRNYLTNLLIEKGITEDINFDMGVEGHINLTYKMQIEFICAADIATQKTIRNTFVKIDFMNGDVLDYWRHITRGMLASLNY